MIKTAGQETGNQDPLHPISPINRQQGRRTTVLLTANCQYIIAAQPPTLQQEIALLDGEELAPGAHLTIRNLTTRGKVTDFYLGLIIPGEPQIYRPARVEVQKINSNTWSAHIYNNYNPRSPTLNKPIPEVYGSRKQLIQAIRQGYTLLAKLLLKKLNQPQQPNAHPTPD
jgi:hypothetical protein